MFKKIDIKLRKASVFILLFLLLNLFPIMFSPALAEDYGLSASVPNGSDGQPMLKIFDPATKAGSIIGSLLAFVGLLFLILVIYGGFTWMTAGGNEQEVNKAKSLLTQAVFGLIIVSAAYLLVRFVGDIILGQFTV